MRTFYYPELCARAQDLLLESSIVLTKRWRGHVYHQRGATEYAKLALILKTI